MLNDDGVLTIAENDERHPRILARSLADIARARGRVAEAAEWERKYDAVRAELKRRAGGPNDGKTGTTF